ncbi:MAG: HAD family hydrolase [Candidatus Rokubacteria bacterium]|nr:HAD family hydrolase [Candidatus Rokubacteria bacterium]
MSPGLATERVDGRSPAALLFDFGGTLDAPGLPWKERVFTLYRAAGIAAAEETFDPLFYGADEALVGTVPATLSLRETVRRLVGGVSAALGVDDERLTQRIATRFLEDALGHLGHNTPLLSRLAGRYRLGIVSNFYGNLEAVCEEAGIRQFFGVVVDSTRLGVRKPDPRIFRHALGELGVEPGDATFVGDSRSRDMEGARGVAMPHIWLVGQAARESDPCCPGDRVIRSLDELPEVLP